jgi:hypothetical protein
MAVSAAYLVGHLQEELGGLEGIERSLSFYSVAIPRYIEYRMMQWTDSNGDKNDEWEELHRRASKQGLDKIMELRGFYIKTGQMAASNIGNACRFGKCFLCFVVVVVVVVVCHWLLDVFPDTNISYVLHPHTQGNLFQHNFPSISSSQNMATYTFCATR